jgi:hypothetical protein
MRLQKRSPEIEIRSLLGRIGDPEALTKPGQARAVIRPSSHSGHAEQRKLEIGSLRVLCGEATRWRLLREVGRELGEVVEVDVIIVAKVTGVELLGRASRRYRRIIRAVQAHVE